MNNYLKFILLTLGFLGLEAIFIAYIDVPISLGLRHMAAETPWFIDIFRFYTDLGKAKWYLVPSGIGIVLCAAMMRFAPLSYITRERLRHCGERLSFLFLCVVASGVLADIIKPILGRARPALLEQDNFYGFHPFSFHAVWNSMPSGHTTTVFTMVFVLIKFYPAQKGLWTLLGSLLALSRIMVNAHYASDVIAGIALAYLTVEMFQILLARYGNILAKHSIFPIDRKNPISYPES